MIKELVVLASHLDAKGLRKEADYLDAVINKIANKDAPVTHNIEESYPIGEGYCQLKLSTGEHFHYKCLDLPDFNEPGLQVSEEEISDLHDANLLEGDGAYNNPQDFLRGKGFVLKIKQDPVAPDGSRWISSNTSGGKTACYYELNGDYFELTPLSGDCTNGETIRSSTIYDAQRK
jgi:hypothetical protein